MNNFLYYVAIVLVLLWALGFFVLQNTSGFIHILLVIALIAVLLRIIQGKNPIN